MQPVTAGMAEAPVLFRTLPPRRASESTNRTLLGAIFLASALLHLALLLRLQTSRTAHTGTRKASQVEIQMTRPPTPVVVPPKVDRPPPPKPVAASRPQPHLSPPDPVHAAPAAQTDEPVPDAPHDDQGTAPAGTGTAEAPVVQAAPPPPPPAPVVEAREGANYLKNPRPAYPRLALREGWEGSVLLRVRVLPNGQSEAINVVKSSGRTVLDTAAVEAVKGWTFVPATQGGNAIAGWVNVPIQFRLQ